jgi:hypothetical protein
LLSIAHGSCSFDVLARNRLLYIEITGANVEQAQFFLQSANGDLDVSNDHPCPYDLSSYLFLQMAMSTFFESDGAAGTAGNAGAAGVSVDDDDDDNMEEDEHDSLLPTEQALAPPASGQALGGNTLGGANIGGATSSFVGGESSSSTSQGTKRKAPAQNSRFATLATLSGSSGEQDDKKKPQEWFAGGDRRQVNQFCDRLLRTCD